MRDGGLPTEKISKPAIVVLVAAVAWEICASIGILPVALFSSPSRIIMGLANLLFDGTALAHIGESLWRLAVGYVLGSAIGVAIGAAMAYNRRVEEILSPTLTMLIAVPTIAWVPVLLVITGLGDTTIIISVVLGTLFSMAYNTKMGIRSIGKHLMDAGRIMGATDLEMLKEVIIPGSLVGIIPGLRLGVGYSWRALIGAEVLASKSGGIGRMIYGARSMGDVTGILVGLALVGIFAYIVDTLVIQSIEKETIVKWGMVKRRESHGKGKN